MNPDGRERAESLPLRRRRHRAGPQQRPTSPDSFSLEHRRNGGVHAGEPGCQGGFRGRGAAISAVRTWLNECVDDPGESLGQIGPQLTKWHSIAGLVRRPKFFQRPPTKRVLSGDKEIEQNTDAVDIARRGRRLSCEDFGCEVERRSCDLALAEAAFSSNTIPVPKSPERCDRLRRA